MPEQVRCPSCEAPLRVPDNLLGKNVKCPKCQETFIAEVEEPEEPKGIVREPKPARRSRPAEELEEEEYLEEEEERPRRRSRRRRSSGVAKSDVIGPAISIMVVGGLSIAVALLDLVFRLLGFGLLAGMAPRSGGIPASQMSGYSVGVVLGSVYDVFSMIVPIVMLVGAVKMKNLQSYGLSVTSCILAMLPLHCCCFLGLPFGIWGLVMLNKPEVKDAFR